MHYLTLIQAAQADLLQLAIIVITLNLMEQHLLPLVSKHSRVVISLLLLVCVQAHLVMHLLPLVWDLQQPRKARWH